MTHIVLRAPVFVISHRVFVSDSHVSCHFVSHSRVFLLWWISQKKARKHEKHLLAKQTSHPDIQPATKLGPIAATSPPVSSNTATSTLATSTVKMVAELDAKLLCMEQRWAQTSTSPLPEGIRNAIMDLRAALVIQESVAVQPVEVPAYNVQVSRNREKQGNVKREKMSEKEMESTARRGEERSKRRRV